jgi:cell division protein FtsI (penicillin-binding protein 3)
MRPVRQLRMLVVAGLFAALFALLLLRAVELTVLRGPEFARRAASQHTQRIALVPNRGPIVDRTGDPLALSVEVPSLYVRPREFTGQAAALPRLAEALALPAREVRSKVETSQPFVWLARQVTPKMAKAVEEIGLRGVGSVEERRRFYPHGSLAAHVLGFVGVDSKGLEGLEQRLERFIQGESQSLNVARDARGREIFRSGLRLAPAEGSRVELALHGEIQAIAERELAAGVAQARAVRGTALVLDPWTGEVLALANVPSFNPNDPGSSQDGRWRDRIRNRAITDPYEPGSTFKVMLAAAALEERVVRPNEMVFCENGQFRVGGNAIHDPHPHGWLSFAEVIQYSSNIGVTKVGERLGRERYHAYLRAFGFGERSGIGLPGESPGILRPVEAWGRIDLATHCFGQGVAATPLQMALAFGVIANGGKLMRPILVRRIVAPGGETVLEQQPTVVRQVVAPETARLTTELLRRAVEDEGGTGGRARLDGFRVAGKTGTAQKVEAGGDGYSGKRVASFVGFVPADRPRVVILVLIDEPGGASVYGGVVAAPVFRAIAAAVLRVLGVHPARELPVDRVVPTSVAATRLPTHGDASRGGEAGGIPPSPDATPSFLGMSLREALTTARAGGWQVRVSGTGWVAAQVPAVGTPQVADRRLVLELRPGRATARN